MVCTRLSTEEIELAILLTIALGFVVLALALLLAGIVSQAIGAARDARKYPPPGQQFQVRGRRATTARAWAGATCRWSRARLGRWPPICTNCSNARASSGRTCWPAIRS